MKPANANEEALVSYLAAIKPRKIGFEELRTDVEGWCADIELDGRYDLFRSECIFDDCDDALAKQILTAFLAKQLSISWSVAEQLSKLLSVRGRLVSNIMDRLLKTLDWSTCATHQLFLSYLALRSDGANLAAGLLDVVPEDARDGLFLACYKLNSEPLDRKVMASLVKWNAENCTLGSYAWGPFIAKWLRLYPYHDLEPVIRLYFKRHFER